LPTNFWDTVAVPNVEVETTAPTTPTVDGTALGAMTAVEAFNQALSHNESMNQWLGMNQMPQDSISLQTQAMTTAPPSSNTLGLTASQYNALYNQAFNIQSSGTNSSMATKTNKASSAAFKPVTLTMTGQLKPSTLTKAPPPKSARSTKPKVHPTTGLVNGW